MQLTFLGFSGLVNAIFCTAVGLFVYFKKPQDARNRIYCLFDLSIAFYSFGYFMWQGSLNSAEALLWFKFLVVGIILINATFIHFVFTLLNEVRWKSLIFFLNYTVSAVFILGNLSGHLYEILVPKFGLGLWPIPKTLFHVYLGFWFLQTFYGLACLYRGYRYSLGRVKTQIWYVFVSTAFGYFGGATNWPMWYGIKLPPYPNILISVYVAILAYAIVRHRLLDIEVVVKKTLVFSGLFGMVMAVVALMTTLTRDFMAQAFQVSAYFSTVLSAFVVVLLYGPAHRFLVNVTDRVLFQKRESIREVLRRLSERIITILDLNQVAKIILDTFEESLRAETGVLLLRTSGGYQTLQSYGLEEALREKVYSLEDPLIELFDRRRRLIRLEEEEVRKKLPLLFLARMETLKAVIAVPLFLHDGLIGVLTLGKKKSDQEYTAEEIDYFPTVASQVAIALSNARLYHESLEARKKIEEMQMELIHREKMAFVADLVKGIAHEVFNPLLPIYHGVEDLQKNVFVSLMDVLESEESKLDPAQRTKYLEAMKELRSIARSIKVNSEHIHLVIDTLSKMQKEDQEAIGPLDFKMFLKDSRALIGMELHSETQEIPVIEDIQKRLPPIKGNPTLLKQVFVNLFKNAIQAMEGKEEKKITIKADTDPAEPGFLKVDFSDTGQGIPADKLPRIFDFGFTTKGKKGQGIGLSQCRLIIEKFEGRITCTSQPGEGTTFTLHLPLWEKKND